MGRGEGEVGWGWTAHMLLGLSQASVQRLRPGNAFYLATEKTEEVRVPFRVKSRDDMDSWSGNMGN